MRPPTGKLLELVTALDGLGRGPTLAALGHALQHADLTPDDVAGHVKATPRHYNREPVVVRDAYEVLVMTWMPGQSSVPHDHSGSTCAMHVVRGDAVESSYRVAPDGFADLQYESTLKAGDVIAGQDAGVHSIRNPAGEGLLVTVHIYSPPLRDIRQFRSRPDPTRGLAKADPHRKPTVVIVGGGFSGTMAAAQTLRRARRESRPVHVVLVERRGAVGEGLAYGTREPVHLLNVPAARMSAWPDQPNDFLEWAQRRDPTVKPGDFLPRTWYGEYVRETLLKEAEGDTATLAVTFDEARRVARHPAGGWMVHLARDTSIRAEAVILAIGHRPPNDPIGVRWTGPRTRFIADPWRPFATNVVGPDDAVVVLGSGLTAVDTVLSLCQQPRTGPITLVSRNGLLPQPHSPTPVSPVDLTAMVESMAATPDGVKAKSLARELRSRAKALPETERDWRRVVDGLRPHTSRLWRLMSVAERRRFLTRLRPFWEVHRHRMALAVVEPFHQLIEQGSVRLLPGRVESATASAEGVRVSVRGRGETKALDVAWVINCTGPLPSNSVESNPVVGSLLVSGLLRPDEMMLGVDTTATGNAVAVDGREVPDLFVIGTLRKSMDWESTAVPELRSQAAGAAERVLALLENLFHQGDGI